MNFRTLLITTAASSLLCGPSTLRAADTPLTDQTALAKSLIIPRTEMQEASVEEALSWIGLKSKELDPQKKGINLVLKDLPAAAKQHFEAPVTWRLTNVSIWDVIQRAAVVGKLEVTATKDAITVHPKGAKP